MTNRPKGKESGKVVFRTQSSINKLYVVLGDGADFPAQKLDALVASLLPHLGLTANVYVIASGLAAGVPLVERIQKQMKTFLKTHRFVRYNLHFLHPLPPGTTAGDAEYFFRYYYQPWKRGSIDFEQEGYVHQEIPRLSLFTVVAPRDVEQLPFLTAILGMLGDHLIVAGLYVQEETTALAEAKELGGKVKKVYYGCATTLAPQQITRDMCRQDLAEASCAAFMSGTFSAAAPCCPALFVTAENGRIYPCLDAFSKGAAVANAYEETDAEAMTARCLETWEKERNCIACKEQVFEQYSCLSLSGGLNERVAAVRNFIHARL